MNHRQRHIGVVSRRSILDRGLRIAAAEGLAAATIGTLATALGMSKSGVFAHFGSKEALDAALVDAAHANFQMEVWTPAQAAPAGVARLVALCEGFLLYLARTPEGVAALTPDHAAFGPGASPMVRQRVLAWRDAWRGALGECIEAGMRQGELSATSPPDQVSFELRALLEAAGRGSQSEPSTQMAGHTRAAIDRLLHHWSAS